MKQKQALISETLSLDEGVPLFDFNVNFTALKKLLVDFNIVIDEHKEQLNELRALVRTKADRQIMQAQFAQLNSSFNLSEQSHLSLSISPKKKDGVKPIDDLCQKSKWVMMAVDKLLKDSATTNENMTELEKKLGEKAKSLSKKMEDKMANLDDTMKKNMDLYFKDANMSFARLQAKIKDSQLDNSRKLGDALALINRKVNEQSLKSQLDAVENRINSNLQRMIEADSVKRSSHANDLAMKIKDSENATQQRQNTLQNKLAELIQKINKSLSSQSFEKEKAKIYEKLSQQRGRIEDLTKKAEDYVDYKRSTTVNAQKSKQQTMAIKDDITKLGDKIVANTSLGNVGAILQKLDPHKICELDATQRVHENRLIKLEKAQSNNSGLTLQQPQINHIYKQSVSSTPKSGLTSQQVRKFIKQYLNQLDLEARIKKVEKDMTEFGKRVDTVGELEKKLFLFTKQFDFGSITRQLSKKCNSDETRRDVKVTNGRIDQLHEFFKMMRKQLDQISQFVKKNEYRNATEPTDNALLTGKKLYTIGNCLSCYSTSVNTKNQHRRLRTPNVEPSIEVGEFRGYEQEARRLNSSKARR